MQANSPDTNDKVHIVLKRKPAKNSEDHAVPSTDSHPENEVSNQESPVQDEELKPQDVSEVKDEKEVKLRSTSKPYLDGYDEPLDDFTYDGNSF